MTRRSEEVKRQNLPFSNDAEDGKFFLKLNDFLKYFEKIIQMGVDYSKKAFAFQISLLDLADNNVMIEVDFDSAEELIYFPELSWDIFVGNNFDVQIEPYKVTSPVKTTPANISVNPIIEKLIIFRSEVLYRVYQGLKITDSNLIYTPSHEI